LRHKTTRRQAYESLALPDVFDTLLWNERGEATEFTRGNLIVKAGGRLLTPSTVCGLLPGTLRAALLARGAVREAVITLAELDTAEALWFVNSVRGAQPVTVVADVGLGG
jgi:para-aminobenzoate synthetase/4-amino-4-deoxychorismate lyase